MSMLLNKKYSRLPLLNREDHASLQTSQSSADHHDSGGLQVTTYPPAPYKKVFCEKTLHAAAEARRSEMRVVRDVLHYLLV